MLKLTLHPGEFLQIGDEIRVIFSGGSANNIHLLVDAPRQINVARNSGEQRKGKFYYYKEKDISKEAKEKIRSILMEERREGRGVSPTSQDGNNARLT